jgi:hypothetical protein
MSSFNQSQSVFIPSIHRSVEQAYLRYLFESLWGEVVRVDFFEMNPVKKDWKRAAIYCADYSWVNVNEFLNRAEQDNFMLYNVGDKMFKATMVVNKTPVPFTDQNIHQLSHSVSQLYELVEQQSKIIKMLIEENEKKDQQINELKVYFRQTNPSNSPVFCDECGAEYEIRKGRDIEEGEPDVVSNDMLEVLLG